MSFIIIWMIWSEHALEIMSSNWCNMCSWTVCGPPKMWGLNEGQEGAGEDEKQASQIVQETQCSVFFLTFLCIPMFKCFWETITVLWLHCWNSQPEAADISSSPRLRVSLVRLPVCWMMATDWLKVDRPSFIMWLFIRQKGSAWLFLTYVIRHSSE